MTKTDAARVLKNRHREIDRFLTALSRKRSMRPSEIAMTKASYFEEQRALELTYYSLTGEPMMRPGTIGARLPDGFDLAGACT